MCSIHCKFLIEWNVESCFCLCLLKMTNKYTQKGKERFQREAIKDIEIFLQKRKTKGKKRPEKDIQILLKKKNKKNVSIIGA